MFASLLQLHEDPLPAAAVRGHRDFCGDIFEAHCIGSSSAVAVVVERGLEFHGDIAPEGRKPAAPPIMACSASAGEDNWAATCSLGRVPSLGLVVAKAHAPASVPQERLLPLGLLVCERLDIADEAQGAQHGGLHPLGPQQSTSACCEEGGPHDAGRTGRGWSTWSGSRPAAGSGFASP